LNHFVDRQKLPSLATPEVGDEKIDSPKTCDINAKERNVFSLNHFVDRGKLSSLATSKVESEKIDKKMKKKEK